MKTPAARPVVVVRWQWGRGGRSFREMPLWHVARGVYEVTLPAEAMRLGDLEYYISAFPCGGDPIRFPATAPALCQTVMVYPAAR